MLPATTATPPRIYYAGRHGRQHVGHASQYGIGALEYLDGDWRRTGAPLLMGTPDRPSVLEPRVVLANGTYIMWYLATPHEVAPGEQPDYELRCVTSPNGFDQWSEPTRFTSPSEGFFDVALGKTDDGWTMILAAGTNLHRTSPYPAGEEHDRQHPECDTEQCAAARATEPSRNHQAGDEGGHSRAAQQFHNHLHECRPLRRFTSRHRRRGRCNGVIDAADDEPDHCGEADTECDHDALQLKYRMVLNHTLAL